MYDDDDDSTIDGITNIKYTHDTAAAVRITFLIRTHEVPGLTTRSEVSTEVKLGIPKPTSGHLRLNRAMTTTTMMMTTMMMMKMMMTMMMSTIMMMMNGTPIMIVMLPTTKKNNANSLLFLAFPAHRKIQSDFNICDG